MLSYVYVIMFSLMLNVTLLETLSLLDLVNDNSADILVHIDRRVLNNIDGAAQRQIKLCDYIYKLK